LTAIVKRGSPASLPDVWLQALISATAGITRLFRTLLYVGVLVLMLYLYAWYLYPLMPKSLGGGAPATIRLIVTADDIPLPLLSELGVQSPEIPRQSVTTAPLSLLYSTSDTLFVRTPADRVVSIASSTVNAILWKETGVPLVDTGATTSRASVLMSVHFDVNRTTVAPAVEPLLREAAARVAQEAGRCVQLEGHADADGTAVYNRELSRLRVEAVQVILERAAMPRERIRVVAYGSTQPRLDVASASAKAQNRRVDVSVLPCATK
jgi:outer membrane protein OmpA-like peptidoglycan-associated protein